MKLGIFGGSFDPPHIGHLIFSTDAHNDFGIDEVVWLVNHTPCHKTKPVLPFAQRIQFCRLITEKFNFITVSDLEESLSKPNYTFDSLQSIKKGRGEKDEYFLMIGMDQAKTIDTWKNSDSLKENCQFIVMNRGDEEEENLLNLKEYRLIKRRIDVSSTEIRERIRKGDEYKAYLGEQLADLIKSAGCYR
ncbi:nicotinate (nicotinamide) nucleotide adenylyltransferase [candidate division WOR-3 bacterium]|nr:nicotinate (nicotinamide) nucleotide adenylyltransferase [candidate division WOR-3 bacterium]